jgi:hypothetical protein
MDIAAWNELKRSLKLFEIFLLICTVSLGLGASSFTEMDLLQKSYVVLLNAQDIQHLFRPKPLLIILNDGRRQL